MLKDAFREYSSGHRGYHFFVSVREETARVFPKYRNVKCEIQVKTILEEAFDAKTHDLTYKPGRWEVSEELEKQFAILAGSLHAIDRQSEFLQDLILEEEKEFALRRQACALFYFQDEDALAVARELGIDINVLDPDKLKQDETSKLAEKIKLTASKGLSKGFCKFVALCALKLSNEYLAEEALQYSRRFVEESPGEGKRFLMRSSVKWVFGYFEDAIEDASEGVGLAMAGGDQDLLKDFKNSFVYFVTDWKLQKGEENKEWVDKARKYVGEIKANIDTARPDALDTCGIFTIAFENTRDEIDAGRALIKRSLDRRPDDEVYKYFFRYHEYIALRRLLKIA
jgi:hypothetical protein